MKIRSLRIEHFRKFTDPIILTDIADGVNVLAEGNEFGKSTLLAAIRGVLFERHVSKAANVASMQHWTNKTSPTVELEFELSSGRYKIEKRFLHKEPYARLTMPNGTIHHGEAAEEHLQHILNFTQAGKTGSKPENVGMWAALWVTQRDSADQADLSDSARQTIHGCLEDEVGALAGGTRGKMLLADVRADLAKIRNGLGKPAGRYKQTIEELEHANEELSETQGRQQRLVQDVRSLQNARRKRADALAAGEEERTDTLLAEAGQKRDVAQRFEEQERTAAATLSLYESRVADVVRDVDSRAELLSRIAAAEDALTLLADQETAAFEAYHEAELALTQQRELVAALSDDYDQAAAGARTARTVVDLATTSANLVTLNERLMLGEAAQTKVNALTAKLASASISEADLTNVRSLDKKLRQTQAVLEAQATQLSFVLLPDAIARVKVNGQHPSNGTIAIIEDASIAIEGLGDIKIQPGIKDRETLLARQASEARALRNALQSISADDIEHAEALLATRQQCERELEQTRLEVATHTPADSAQKLKAGLESLRNHIAVLSTALQEGMSAAGISVLPELAMASEALRKAVKEESDASSKLAIARAPIADLEREHSGLLRLHAQAESQKEAAVEEQQRRTRERDRLLLQETPETLAERLKTANVALLAQRGVVEEMQKNRPEETVAGMDARIARYQKAKQMYADDRQQTSQDIAILESRIEREEGVGIEEQVSSAQRLVEYLEATCQRFVREIKVLELLLESLETAERAAKERYLAPIVRRVTPYLQTLFPGAAISCDDEFKITGIVRDSQQSESFTGLSGGTQEQIAVLTRLAFADVLKEGGQPAMVILDDALVYSDPERMERMFDLISRSATRTQILIFTCRREIFARLGGHRLNVITQSA